jgi:hypothetical protein
MNGNKLTLATLMSAAALIAQGPPPGPPPGGFGFGFGPGPGGPPPATVTGAPYSGVETVQSQQTLSDGTQIARSEQVKVYRDSQGRVRSEHTMTPPGGSPAQARTMISIIDPVAGYETRLDTERSTAVKTALPSARTGTRPAPPAGAPTPEIQDLGVKTINGLAVTGTRRTLIIPAGAIGNSQAIQSVHEVWVSQDLQVPLLVSSTDPRSGTSTMQLGSVVRAEPDASLFQIPASYAVTTRERPEHGPNP